MSIFSSLRRDLKGGTKAYKEFNDQRNKWVEQQLRASGIEIPEVVTTDHGEGDRQQSIALTAEQKARLAAVPGGAGWESGGDSGGWNINPAYQNLERQFQQEQWAKVAAAEEQRKKLSAQWVDTLDPATKQKALNEFKLHSSDMDSINKYGSLATKALLGTIAGGTALTAAGVIGGGAGAGASGGVSAAEIAGAAGLPELGLATQTGLGATGAGTAAAGGAAAAAGGGGAGVAGAAGSAAAAAGSGLLGLSGAELAKLGLAGVGALAGYKAQGDATDTANAALSSADKAAADAAQLGRDQLNFSIRQYDEAAPYRDAAAKTAQQVSEAQLAQMKLQDELAKEYAEYNRTTFRPLEQGIVADAEGYDTPEKRNAAAQSAIADVNKQFASVNDATARRLAASGIDPASTRAMSVMQGQGYEQAKAGAGSAYTARKGVETTGFARKMDAASLGRNLPSSQATSAGLALSAGNSATSNAGAALTANNTGVPQVQNAYNAAAQNAIGSGSLYNSAAQLAQRAGVIGAEQWGNLGNSLGQWANSQGGNAILNRWFGS